MKKTLPSLRVEKEVYDNISRAILKHNEKSLIKLSIQDFRRYSYELLSQAILQNKLKDLPIRLE